MTTGFVQRILGKIKVAELWVNLSKGIWESLSGVQVRPTWTNAGAPTSGGSGTLAGYAGPGDLLEDTTNKNLYINTGTLASPTWTLIGGSSGGPGSSPVPQQAYNTNTNASGTVTLTGAECTGGSEEVWVNCTGAQSGAFAIDLPTVASLVSAMQSAGLNPQPGGSFILNIMNTCGSAETGTVTTATGWTLTGTMTAAQNTYRKLLVTMTSLTAFAAQSLGEYAITGAV